MRIATFQTGSTVPATATVHLDARQADARSAQVAPVGNKHSSIRDDRRLPYVAKEQLYFKAGETIGVEGVIERPLANALGIPEVEQNAEREVARDAAAAKAKAAAVGKAEKAVTAARGMLNRAEQTVEKMKAATRKPSAEKLAVAERGIEVAKDKLAAAEKALADLSRHARRADWRN